MSVLGLVLIGVLTAAVISMPMMWYRRHIRNGEWHVAADRRKMFRWHDNAWQYRPMTEEEILDDLDSWIW